MDNIGCAQEEPPLIPRAKKKKTKKKKPKNEPDPVQRIEKKRKRLERALAISAAIRAKLEEKKRRKIEQQRLDTEGATIAEAVALRALCEDSDDPHQIVLKNDSMDLCYSQDHDSNIGSFMGGRKVSVPRTSFGKCAIKGRGWVSDAYGVGCNCNDCRIRRSFAPKSVDQGLPAVYVKGNGEAAEISPGLIAAQAVSALQISEDAPCGAFTGKETSTKITGSCLDGNANLY